MTPSFQIRLAEPGGLAIIIGPSGIVRQHWNLPLLMKIGYRICYHPHSPISPSRPLTDLYYQTNRGYPKYLCSSYTAMKSTIQQFDPLAIRIPVAKLETISFEALRGGDQVESTKLFHACCKHGIFYLYMLSTIPNVLQAVEDIYALEEIISRRPEAGLMRYNIDELSQRKWNGSAVSKSVPDSNMAKQHPIDTSL